MPICPQCLTRFPDEDTTCPHDGTALAPDSAYAYVDRDLAPGDVVGEYVVEGKLGEGGFGSVYAAAHPVIGKRAAVKVLSRTFSANPQMVSRFIAEARAVNQIRHRNIIDIFSFGQLPDGRQYYVMELLDGMTFDAHLERQGRLSFPQALPILRGIARALDAAHAKGLLHRDLKPENVFLVFDEDGGVLPKLLDFGLVKLLGSASGQHKTKTGTPMGTPLYMSPEQCRGEDVDGRTDVYAFGVMAFEVLTGELPFDGEGAMAILIKHMEATPPNPSAVAPDLPRLLDAPILRMLAKAPDARPATVGRALDELVIAARSAGIDVPAPAAPLAPEVSASSTPDVAAIGSARTVALAPAQTFVGAESDVESVPRPPARRGTLVLVVGAALAVVVGISVFTLTARGRRGGPEPGPSGVVAAASASPIVSASATHAPVAVASSPPPARDTVLLRVEGAPPGAVVSMAGTKLGPAPGPFEVRAGAPVTIRIAAPEHRARDVEISPVADVVVTTTLERIPPKPAQKGRTISRELEDF